MTIRGCRYQLRINLLDFLSRCTNLSWSLAVFPNVVFLWKSLYLLEIDWNVVHEVFQGFIRILIESLFCPYCSALCVDVSYGIHCQSRQCPICLINHEKESLITLRKRRDFYAITLITFFTLKVFQRQDVVIRCVSSRKTSRRRSGIYRVIKITSNRHRISALPLDVEELQFILASIFCSRRNYLNTSSLIILENCRLCNLKGGGFSANTRE